MSIVMSKKGEVVSIYLYPQKGSEPVEVVSVETVMGEGLKGDRKRAAHRQVTLLSSESWQKAVSELGVELSPSSRRANVLVSGIDLAFAIGKKIEVGEVMLQINGETTPCQLMDEVKPGLRKALSPEIRAGVFGSILRQGRISIGDIVAII